MPSKLTLFQDIADAIKDKTGSTDTMKPAEFPKKISEISAGTNAEILENIPIALDFSGGNQTITAPDGTLVKTAIIQKPDTLTPANIAQGVDIAGIIGTLAGGGGGKNITFKTGQVNASNTASKLTVEHGLGIVPDIILLFAIEKSTYASMNLMWSITFSKAFIDACGGTSPGQTALRTNGQYTLSFSQSSEGFESQTEPYSGVYAVTDTSFKIGGTYGALETGQIYAWKVIGGLF